MGYRAECPNLVNKHHHHFDALEVTVDHVIWGGGLFRASLNELEIDVPLFAHGIGLSIGTDGPLDRDYLDQVAEVVEFLKSPWYSEHLAFTKVPGYDLANLLPVPKTKDVARQIIDKVKVVQSVVKVPFVLENITYMFEWPDSAMSDADFFERICGETGAGVLLDVENLYINSRNHGLNPHELIDRLPEGSVVCMHMAGGCKLKGMLTDTHDHRLRSETLDLFDAALARHRPEVVILERDGRLDESDEILADLADIAARVAKAYPKAVDAQPAPA